MNGGVVSIIGLPASGKTTLALTLAAGRPLGSRTCLVLHTDLVKVTLRLTSAFPAGPAWVGDLDDRLDRIRPVLAHHAHKARRDGVDLVVEGTLALACEADLVVLLQAEPALRSARTADKPIPARQALAKADLSGLSAALSATRVGLVLDAAAPIADLVAQIRARWP